MVEKNKDAEKAADVPAEKKPESAPMAQAPTAQAVPEKKEDMVEVPKSELAAFVKRLGNLEKDNTRLMAAADKSRLANIDAKMAAGQPLIRTVRLSRLSDDGPIIIAWKLTKNVSYVSGNRLIEDQVMQVFFEDGKNQEMPLINFYRGLNKKVVAEIISRTKDEKTGEEMLKLQTKEGKDYTIPLKFVN